MAACRYCKSRIEAARFRGCPVPVCAQAGGDPRAAALLVGLGVRELSMSPSRSTRVRYALRSCTVRDAEELARQSLAALGEREVPELLAAFARHLREAGDPAGFRGVHERTQQRGPMLE